jgi:hypothetical protein
MRCPHTDRRELFAALSRQQAGRVVNPNDDVLRISTVPGVARHRIGRRMEWPTRACVLFGLAAAAASPMLFAGFGNPRSVV